MFYKFPINFVDKNVTIIVMGHIEQILALKNKIQVLRIIGLEQIANNFFSAAAFKWRIFKVFTAMQRIN
jgi:hypothetical protein